MDQRGRAADQAVRCSHEVHFYADDADLIDRVAEYVAAGVTSRETCIVIATAAHRRALQARLQAGGTAPRPRQLLLLDAAETLQGFMRSGRPDPALFESTVGALIRSTVATRPPVRAYGEMVALLWAYGNVVGALELEELWNALQQSLAFPLLCAYPSGDLELRDDEAVERIAALHTGHARY